MSPADLRALEFHAKARRLEYVRIGYELGFSFTPLDGKRPIIKGWQNAPRESLEQALEWAAAGNIGVRTGRASGGLIGIDTDPGADVAALQIPHTVASHTGRETALHHYLITDEHIGNSSGRLGPHVDVKGDGGQIVFPGSIHPDTGREYVWVEGCELARVPIATMPRHLLAMLTRLKPQQPTATVIPEEIQALTRTVKADRYAIDIMQLELQVLAEAIEGTRNDTLNRAAYTLGRFVGAGRLGHAEVYTALCSAASKIGLCEQEYQRTIMSGMLAGAKEPRTDGPKTLKPAPPESEYILVPGPHLTSEKQYIEQSTTEFASRVLSRLPPECVYRRDYVAGEILGGPGHRVWVPIKDTRMRLIVDSHVKLGKWTKTKSGEEALVYVPCNLDYASLVVEAFHAAPKTRNLDMIVNYCVFLPDWKLAEPGWNTIPTGGIFYDEPEELQGFEPETDRDKIRQTLEDIVVDFPFKTDADRENFFGLLLTPIIAPALEGNRPMHLLNAPLERTGKTKLVNEVFGGVVTGRDISAMQLTEREEEREKRILSLLFLGHTIVNLDNLPGWIDSPALASLLTTQTLSGRVLGFSRIVELPNRLTVLGTGNNIRASGEIAKRMIPIMLQPTTARPETRTDFVHPNIRSYVRKRRRAAISCLVGMVLNWIDAGRPAHPRRLGGFEDWSEAVGGILRTNGFKVWRENEQEWLAAVNERGAELEAFVTKWYEQHGYDAVSSTDLRVLAEREGLFGSIFARPSARAAEVAFGRMLSKHVDMPVLKWFIRRSYSGNNPRFNLEPIN